jgi:hypothetical protein
MAGGGALFKFIEKLFIKASNDIRLGRGKWKGLDQKQRIVQHDNLTKKVTEFQKTGKLPEGTEQYFGIDAEKAFKIKTGEIQPSFSLSREKLMTQFPHIPEGEIDRIMTLPVEEQKQVLTKLMGELTEIRGGQGIKGMDERTALKIKYQGLTDDLLDKILIDDNPQRKAEVLATMDEYLKLKEVGKGDEEAFKIVVDSFQKPTKHAEGGRAEFIFGGSAGLRAMWKKMMQGISKRRGEPVPKLFPKLSARDREMEKLVMGTPEQKAFREGEEAHKLEGIDLLINRLKHDKKILERQAKNKAMKDPSLDFLTKHLEETVMPEVYGPHLKKYTNIDKDILQMENIKKNLIMKDRKLNAEGGRIGYSGGGKAGLPAVTMGTPQMNMQQPQMPAGPQPAGIPGGTIVAQNQMQQAPWMGPQMQQGIGGMPQRGQPRPGGMPRPMAAEGGRIGYAAGGFNAARRAFLKMMAGITGAGIAGGTGLLKFGKAAKVVPKVTETIVQSNAAGMPAWFPSLVKRVIKEGEDITGKAGAMERQTVHRSKLPESGTPIEVTQDLTTGDTIVDIGVGKHGFSAGHLGQPIRLELKKGEWIEGAKGKKGIKTKDEFTIEEAEFTGGHPENIKFEESTLNKYGEQGSDLTEVEGYARVKLDKTGKAKSPKEMSGLSSGKSHGWRTEKGKSQAMAEGRAESRADEWQPDWDDSLPDPDDYASGGLARMLGE